MGNFSNVPQDRARDSIAKRYVGVRLQQGVPLLDADWNELEDLRRYELETVGTWFIGDGVPVGSDGFHIIPVNADNDFGIRAGTCLVRGKVTMLDADVRYTTQPRFGDPNVVPPLPALSTPGGATEAIAYLDVWEREVNSAEDIALIDLRIGLETTVRTVREWAVRLAAVPADLALLDAPPTGHVFYRLAYLRRQGANARITGPMIEDLRETQISIRRRIEVRNNLGTLVVDDPRFQLLLETTRNNVLAFVRYITTGFNPLGTPMTGAELLGIQAAMRIVQPAEAGLALLGSQVLANQGALHVLSQVYDAENDFLVVWRDVVMSLGGTPKKYVSYQHFVEGLDKRLHDALIGPDMGLLPALQAEDLAAATAMQDAIAALFAQASNANVPRGSIQLFLSKSPPSPLTQGQTVTFEFTARSNATLADSYIVEILPAAGWTRRLVDDNGAAVPGNRIPIGASGAEVKIPIQVVIGTGSSDLQLRVTSVSNPEEVTQTSTSYTLTEGGSSPPPASKVRLEITGATPHGAGTATYDKQANTVSMSDVTNIAVRALNDSAAPVTLDLAYTLTNEIGTWVVAFLGGSPISVQANGVLTFVIRVTPGNGAVSATLTATASGTVDGAAVTAEINPTLVIS